MVLTSELESLYAIIRAVASDLDLPTTLTTICSAVCSYSKWEMCDIIILNRKEGLAELVARHPMDALRGTETWPIDESPTLRAIESKHPIAATLQPSATSQGFPRALVVPMVTEEPAACIWFYSSSCSDFTDAEIRHAQAISDHVVVAVRNARLYSRQLDDTAKLTRVLDVQMELIKRVLRGEALDLLVDAISNLLGNPVIVLDQFAQPLAWSSDSDSIRAGIKVWGARFKDSQLVRTEFLRALGVAQVDPFDTVLLDKSSVVPGERGHVLAEPLALGRNRLGYLLVLDDYQPLEQLDELFAQQAGLAIALEMMRAHAAFETTRELRADLLRELFTGTGRDNGDVIRRASYLGVDLRLPNALLLLRARDDEDLSTAGTHGDALSARILRAIASVLPNIVAVRDDRDIVALVPMHGRDHAHLQYTARTLSELTIQVGATTPLLLVGPTCSTPEDYSIARSDCQQGMQACALLGMHGVVQLDEVGAYRFLLSVENVSRLQEFVTVTLGPISRYEEKRHTQLLATLDEFLRANCSYQSTADVLGIHVTTLRYRLERIEMLLRKKLSDPDARFQLQLALNCHKLSSSMRPTPHL
jgi:purine catabolism regulator